MCPIQEHLGKEDPAAMTTDADTNFSPTELWKLYIDSGDYLRDLTDRTLKKRTGIRLVDYKLLQLLVESPEAINDGELRMGTLSHSLRISPSRLTYQISSLEKQGWVEKNKTDSDKRGSVVSITDEGYQVYARAYKVYFSVIGEVILNTITPEEAAVLKNIYTRIMNTTADTK